MTSTSHFAQHYATLRDDELMHIALTRELVDEAQDALRTELRARGIADVASYRTQMAGELVVAQAGRDDQIAHWVKVASWLARWLYAMGVVSVLFGVYRTFVPDPGGAHDDIMALAGGVLIVLTWLLARVPGMLAKKVLFREPPR